MRDRSDLAMRVGARLRKLRQELTFTLEKLAAATDLSPAFLSRIENGRSIPSIPTLQSIADAMSVDIGYFFRESDQKQYTISRKSARTRIVTGKGYEIEILNDGMANPFMEPAIVTNRRMESDLDVSVHDGQEFMYVIEGSLDLHLGKKKFSLKKGDAAYWNGSIPHKGVSTSKKPAKTLNVHLIPGKHIETFQAQLRASEDSSEIKRE